MVGGTRRRFHTPLPLRSGGMTRVSRSSPVAPLLRLVSPGARSSSLWIALLLCQSRRAPVSLASVRLRTLRLTSHLPRLLLRRHSSPVAASQTKRVIRYNCLISIFGAYLLLRTIILYLIASSLCLSFAAIRDKMQMSVL